MLALFGQWTRFPGERVIATFPDRTHFLRQEHTCLSLTEQVACVLAKQRPGVSEELDQILDATGVPVRPIKRRGDRWFAGTADKGWYSRLRGWTQRREKVCGVGKMPLASLARSPIHPHGTVSRTLPNGPGWLRRRINQIRSFTPLRTASPTTPRSNRPRCGSRKGGREARPDETDGTLISITHTRRSSQSLALLHFSRKSDQKDGQVVRKAEIL